MRWWSYGKKMYILRDEIRKLVVGHFSDLLEGKARLPSHSHSTPSQNATTPNSIDFQEPLKLPEAAMSRASPKDGAVGMKMHFSPAEVAQYSNKQFIDSAKGRESIASMGFGYCTVQQWAHDVLKWQLLDTEMQLASGHTRAEIESQIQKKLVQVMAEVDRRLAIEWQTSIANTTSKAVSGSFDSLLNQKRRHPKATTRITYDEAYEEPAPQTPVVEVTTPRTPKTATRERYQSVTKNVRSVAINTVPVKLEDDNTIKRVDVAKGADKILVDQEVQVEQEAELTNPVHVQQVLSKYKKFQDLVEEEKKNFANVFIQEELTIMENQIIVLQKELDMLEDTRAERQQEMADKKVELDKRRTDLHFQVWLKKKADSHPCTPRTKLLSSKKALLKFGECQVASPEALKLRRSQASDTFGASKDLTLGLGGDITEEVKKERDEKRLELIQEIPDLAAPTPPAPVVYTPVATTPTTKSPPETFKRGASRRQTEIPKATAPKAESKEPAPLFMRGSTPAKSLGRATTPSKEADRAPSRSRWNIFGRRDKTPPPANQRSVTAPRTRS
eukprot:Platyproteum_vivax@DN10048_c0_g1_i1.p1